MAEDAKDLSAQEQEAENAWRYAKSRVLEKVLNKMLSANHGGVALHMERKATHEKISFEEVVDETFAVLRQDFEQNGIRPTKKSFAENCPSVELGQWVLHMWTDPFRKIA